MSKRVWPPQNPVLRYLLGGPMPASWMEDPRERRYLVRPPINDLDSPVTDLFAPPRRVRRRAVLRRTDPKFWGEPQRSAIDVLDYFEERPLPETHPDAEDDHA
jgi:hypothetical protein